MKAFSISPSRYVRTTNQHLDVACSDNKYVEPVVYLIPTMSDFTANDNWLEHFVATHENDSGGLMIIVYKTEGVGL